MKIFAKIFGFAFLTVFSCSHLASAVQVDVTAGRTSVLLDTATLSSVGLDLSGVSSAVVVPGNLGADSVAFPINSRTASPPLLPTTFSYDSGDFLNSFSGKIEHEGSVFFNTNAVEVGNFTIDFDAARISPMTSGFFVESTVGTTAILFDVAPPSALSATATNLTIEASLLVSPEFAGFLGNPALTGAMVGNALVQAVPEPTGTAVLICCGLAGLTLRRRAN